MDLQDVGAPGGKSRISALLAGLHSDQVQRIAAALVVPVAQHHREHREHDERAEGDDDGVDVRVGLDHRRIDREHQEDRDVLVEILHRDRMACGEENVTAVLQQRIHRHHEEARHRADHDQKRVDERHARHEDHPDDHDAHRDSGRQHVEGLPQGDEASRDHRAESHAHRSNALDRKSTRLNSSHRTISYAVFCLKKKNTNKLDSRILRWPPWRSTNDSSASLSPSRGLAPPAATLLTVTYSSLPASLRLHTTSRYY